jgi:hypothetical protein
MNSLIHLMTLIGVEKTLIIASGQYAAHDYVEISDDIIFFFLADHMISRSDAAEKERLRSTIARCGCTQVVFLGVLDEEMRCRLSFQSSYHTLRTGLHFKTSLLPKHAEAIRSTHLAHALLEQHVATQCGNLMDFAFIARRVRKGKLNVRGIVGTLDAEEYKTVFRNGVRYNDFVSMN